MFAIAAVLLPAVGLAMRINVERHPAQAWIGLGLVIVGPTVARICSMRGAAAHRQLLLLRTLPAAVLTAILGDLSSRHPAGVIAAAVMIFAAVLSAAPHHPGDRGGGAGNPD